MLSAILNLFGCSQKSNKNKESAISEGKVLTEEIIDSATDEDLLQIVFDNLFGKFSGDYEKEYETVLTWTRPQQAIYEIWLLGAEVNNGGFNQFYFNSSGQFYKLLPASLRLVGANKFAELTERANEIYEKEHEKITKHQDGTIEGFSKSYDDNPLNDLDDEFYKLYQEENLYALQIDYIRKNKSDFVDK